MNSFSVRFVFTDLLAQIAQLVEQRTENPRVAGSIPALGIVTSLVFNQVCAWDISSVGRALDFNLGVRGSNPRCLIKTL